LFLAFCSGLAAAEPALRPIDVADESPPTFTVYSSSEGLSDEIWSTVGWDKQGFVWAGSASGLARFDGYRWTPWPFAQAHSLVRDMQVVREATVGDFGAGPGPPRRPRVVARFNHCAFHQRFSDTFSPWHAAILGQRDHGFRPGG
jgi:hypothetical protein